MLFIGRGDHLKPGVYENSGHRTAAIEDSRLLPLEELKLKQP
jgi:hypothetical protein